MLLDGQGGDELFGGVSGFLQASPFVPGNRRRSPRRPQQAGSGQPWSGDRSPRTGSRAPLAAFTGVARRLPTPRATVADAALIDQRSAEPWIASTDPLRRELLTESFETSLPELLRYADRSSMAHSREVRLPFLDRRIAELAFSLPPEFIYAHGNTKRILRDAGRGLVPEVILSRRDKVAYEPPQRRWLDQPAFCELIADMLLDEPARGRGLLDPKTVERDLREGTWRDHAAVWRAFNAELWLRLLVPGAT